MFNRHLSLSVLALPLLGAAQIMNPMAVPPALDEDTFHLVVDQHVVQFYPGINTNTYGASAPYLGPTLILHTGDTARIRIENQLAQITSMHWHGLRVPGEFDGGPPREIAPNDHWDVKYRVKNPAGTFWYHPHPDGLTAEQANQGVAGFIIVQDTVESALDLPRTYGVDDFPVAIQDRRFAGNGNFVFGPYGDSVLVNGTPHAYLECPAQVVRLRLLNGSNARVYALGFDDGRDFSVIAGDGGLLNAPVNTDRLWLSNGERTEVLLDLTGMAGDSLLLMSFGSELPTTVPGGNNLAWEYSVLNGIDFPVLRIRVTPQTPGAVTNVPATLVNAAPYDEADATNTRTKILAGMGLVGMGMFTINGTIFDINTINDTIALGALEVWEIENISNMAHPMHIHGGSFYVLDRNGLPPPAWELGPKDVVLVDAGENVRVIMKFEELTDGWPFMYHCHNLMHEDNMMMLQYIVEDQGTGAQGIPTAHGIQLFPSPASDVLRFRAGTTVDEVMVFDLLGNSVLRMNANGATLGSLPVSGLRAGMYQLVLRHGKTLSRAAFVKE